MRACVPAPAASAPTVEKAANRVRSCNILGPTALGFRHRDDLVEVTRLLARLGVAINVVAPLGASPADLARLGDADFNVVLYPELAEPTARYLTKTLKQPCTTVVPIGVGATRDFVRQVAELAGVDPRPVLEDEQTRLPWYTRSVDSTYLTGKRVYLFGDATHVLAAARIAREELGFTVVGLGTYSRELAREVRAAAATYGVEALITDDHLAVEDQIAALHPDLVLGTQMERHIAKRLGLPCAVISAPVHVQDYPARYSPQMGFEGANVLFDTWVHPLMMGLEEHLLTMFRDDFEFDGSAGPSHTATGVSPASVTASGSVDVAVVPAATAATSTTAAPVTTVTTVTTSTGSSGSSGSTTNTLGEWTPEAEKELKKIPFFVRGKARRNTETFARERGLERITLETLYDAKAHFRA